MIREKEIPLKIEVFSENEDREFSIYSKNEIRNILRTIYTRNTRAALYYNGDRNFVLTMLLAVTEDGIWIDPPSRPQDNRNILNSDQIIFVSSHNQAKVQFVTTEALPGAYNENNAIFLPLPLKLLRLQRRDYYRLSTWPKNPLTFVINQVPNQAYFKHEATVMDLSVGGVGLVCQETDLELTPGSTFSNCEIKLPRIGTLTATVQVKSAFDVSGRAGKRMRRAGCVFVKPDGHLTTLLQRYVTQMQLEEVAATHQ